MFCVSRALRAISPYSIFMMDNKSNPSLAGMAVAKRGRLLAKMYKNLSHNQITDLRKRAQAHPNFKRSASKNPPAHHHAAKGPFSKFVKENYDKVRCLNYSRRLSALARLYEIQKPISIADTVIKGPTLGDVIGDDAIKRRLQNVPPQGSGITSAASHPPRADRADNAHSTRRAARARPARARSSRRKAGRSSQSKSARSRVKARAHSTRRASSHTRGAKRSPRRRK